MVDKQQQLLEAMNKREVKIEGIRLPQFFGKMGESVELYFEQLAQYFEAKNIDWQNEEQSTRILAITTANFKGNAAAWYKLNKREIKDMQDLMYKLTDEFVPPDLQERLRDQLYALKQSNCSNLEEYISRFREAIMQVTEMSELDQITYFTRGLVSPTREEVQYRRCRTVSQAMKIALEYDRSHHVRGKNYRPPVFSQDRSRAHSTNHSNQQQQPQHSRSQENEPEPMEIDSGNTARNLVISSSSVTS
ncbi:Hypothetical protein PHPALM_5616 [Phytophthora palmivora]|uniref:Retrotransposon gag domain-containing protein n=1 Tax=Phytophthora palmivora TaxID=4796 RepID=A0A2P4YGX3_9STRA|nr:Hypothetical protein PHPALM_5616 [Phytophthora palmivora]